MRILPRENGKHRRVACIVNMNSWQNNILLRPNLKEWFRIKKLKMLCKETLLLHSITLDNADLLPLYTNFSAVTSVILCQSEAHHPKMYCPLFCLISEHPQRVLFWRSFCACGRFLHVGRLTCTEMFVDFFKHWIF